MLLQRLADLREGIDSVDERIIARAINLGFAGLYEALHTAMDEQGDTNPSSVDEEIKATIDERRVISAEIAKVKFAIGTGTTDPLREQQMREVRHKWGKRANVTIPEIDEIMAILMKDSKRVQDEVRERLLDV